MKTLYTDLYNITELQQDIMRFIGEWVIKEKIPIAQKEIIKTMTERGKKSGTIVYALDGLLKLGYIRRTVETSNKTRYVQIKSI